MDFAAVGLRFRAVRIKRRWRQQDVADRAGVSRSVVSRIELGQWDGLSVASIVAVAAALGIRLRISASWHGADLDRLVNVRHSLLHEDVAIELSLLAGWANWPEVSYAIYRERGIIDILAWHAATRTLLVIELKTEIVDVNELLGKVDEKRRLAMRIARERGLDPVAVSVWVIVAESTTNRRRVAAHSAVLRSALPIDGRTMSGWLRRPHGQVAALSFWSYARQAGTKRGLATVRRVRGPAGRAA